MHNVNMDAAVFFLSCHLQLLLFANIFVARRRTANIRAERRQRRAKPPTKTPRVPGRLRQTPFSVYVSDVNAATATDDQTLLDIPSHERSVARRSDELGLRVVDEQHADVSCDFHVHRRAADTSIIKG